MDKLKVFISLQSQSLYAFFIDAKFSAAIYLTKNLKMYFTTGKKFIEQLEYSPLKS